MTIQPAQRAQALAFNAVFSKMNHLAQVHQSVNLGHGFPDFAAPEFVKVAAMEAVEGDRNQYGSARGVPSLRQAITTRMQHRYHIDYNPDTDILVTQGATEAIFTTLMTFINPGDEVIALEPCYSCYQPAIQLAGGIPKFYSLHPPHWNLNPAALEALFTAKTKVILLNTPHNPTGKVLTDAEMSLVAHLCQKYNVLAISDEVYDELVFDQHVRSHHHHFHLRQNLLRHRLENRLDDRPRPPHRSDFAGSPLQQRFRHNPRPSRRRQRPRSPPQLLHPTARGIYRPPPTLYPNASRQRLHPLHSRRDIFHDGRLFPPRSPAKTFRK